MLSERNSSTSGIRKATSRNVCNIEANQSVPVEEQSRLTAGHKARRNAQTIAVGNSLGCAGKLKGISADDLLLSWTLLLMGSIGTCGPYVGCVIGEAGADGGCWRCSCCW